MHQFLVTFLLLFLTAVLLVPTVDAQSDRFEEIKQTYESRDGVAASASSAFDLGSLRDGITPAALGRIMPGSISNQGRTPANVVIWLESQDERRGFALFSPRQQTDVPSGAVPVAYATIPPRGTLSFADFQIVGEHGDLRQVKGGSGRFIIAAQSEGTLSLESSTRQLAEPEEEDIQMMPRWPSAGETFTPGGSFFPTHFSPRR